MTCATEQGRQRTQIGAKVERSPGCLGGGDTVGEGHALESHQCGADAPVGEEANRGVAEDPLQLVALVTERLDQFVFAERSSGGDRLVRRGHEVEVVVLVVLIVQVEVVRVVQSRVVSARGGPGLRECVEALLAFFGVEHGETPGRPPHVLGCHRGKHVEDVVAPEPELPQPLCRGAELGWRPLPQLGGEQLVQGEVEARALGSTVGNRLVASLVEHLFQLGMVGAHQDGALVGVPRVQGGEVDAVPAVASWPEQPVPHLL